MLTVYSFLFSWPQTIISLIKLCKLVGCLFFNIKCSCMLLCSLSVKVLLDHYHSRQHQYETIHKACFEKVHNQLKYTNTAYFVLFCYSMQKSADNFDPIDFHQICFNWSLVKLNGIVRCNPETSASCRLEWKKAKCCLRNAADRCVVLRCCQE